MSEYFSLTYYVGTDLLVLRHSLQFVSYIPESESVFEFEVRLHLVIGAHTAHYERSNRQTVLTQQEAVPR